VLVVAECVELTLELKPFNGSVLVVTLLVEGFDPPYTTNETSHINIKACTNRFLRLKDKANCLTCFDAEHKTASTPQSNTPYFAINNNASIITSLKSLL
jgi:hypothetical protein